MNSIQIRKIDFKSFKVITEMEILMNIADNKKTRGKLIIFTSYTPGAGKSYLMVSEAVKQQESGKNVVIGFLNGKHRDIQNIPGNNAEEYKLSMEEVLLENPDVVVLDELGMRGINTEKRTYIYQDAEEFLSKGIDVYASANLKKFQSANPYFKNVTGIGMKRTIPDRLLENAESIVFMDREPELMLKDFESGALFGERYMKSKIMQKNFRLETLVNYRKISKEYLERYADKVRIVTR